MKILESFIASPLAGAIGWTLLHSLWEGALISAILGAILMGTRSPRIRYVAGCAALLGIAAAFGITLFHLLPDSGQNFPRFRAVVALGTVPSAATQTDNARTWLSDLGILAPWLAPFWIAGVLFLSLERTMSFFAVRKLRTRGVCFACEEWHADLARLAAQLRVSRSVHLLESCFAEIPMVLGHLRPVILVPIGLLANLPSQQACCFVLLGSCVAGTRYSSCVAVDVRRNLVLGHLEPARACLAIACGSLQASFAQVFHRRPEQCRAAKSPVKPIALSFER